MASAAEDSPGRPDLRHERFEAHYHGDVDFEREELRSEAEMALRRQDAEAAEASTSGYCSALVSERTAPAAPSAPAAPACPAASGSPSAESRRWEAFHGEVHGAGEFFKDRRYLVREFYELKTGVPGPPPRWTMDDITQRLPAAAVDVIEVGCGTGNSCIPVLGANPLARVCACDFSESAVAITASRAERLGIGSGSEPAAGAGAGAGALGLGELPAGRRFHAAVGDPVTAPLVPASAAFLDPTCPGYGAAMLIFTLSAVDPAHHGLVMRRVADSLRPGGFVAFRDYGSWDMAMLRFPGAQRVADRLYVRQDGTLAYFFELEDVQRLADHAGLRVEELRWCRVANRNRRDNTDMRRIFVHAKLRRPLPTDF